ncbi:MAG: MarR family winged helix-turn-helix transcriptional regulator, partial [Geminicoccaceae bacterium]
MADPSAVTPLEGHLGYWLNYVGSHVGLGFRRKLAGRGVTVAEWVVLRLLLGRGGEPPSQLAERMGMTRGAVSRLVERLVAKGLVSREAAGGDRRFQALALTPAGEA